MPRKQIMKKVFDKEFEIEKMRHQILNHKERKENNKMKFLKYAIPICLIMICGIGVLNHNHSNLENNAVPVNNNEKKHIIVNEIDSMGMTLIDAAIQETSYNGQMIPAFTFLREGIILPQDLDKENYYAIYTKNEKTGEYDNLNCYVYNYSKETRSIRIAFSDKGEPIRDYYFDKVGEISKIKDTELMIYQYENTFFTEFKYKDNYFDIETNDISLEELTTLLESIIR